MRKLFFCGLLFCSIPAFSQSGGDDDILAVNKAMSSYFNTIADISAYVTPKRNGVNGWFRQYIAEDNKPADCGNKKNSDTSNSKIIDFKKGTIEKFDPKKFYGVNDLANPQLNISNENAKKLLDLFKLFSSLNQNAFKDHVNHCHKRGFPYLDIVQKQLGELGKLATTVGIIYESGGTNIEAWIAATHSITNIATNVRNNSSEFGSGDNAANGFIAWDVQEAARQAKDSLWKINFAEESLEGKTKAVLLRFFTDLEDMCLIYRNFHDEWLNPAWQFEYEGLMRAGVSALSQITPNTTVKIKTDIEVRDFAPETHKEKIITNYVVNKEKKGRIVGDFVYKIDTTVIEVPFGYKVSLDATQVKMSYRSGRTAMIPLGNFQLKPTENMTSTNEIKSKEVKITLSKRTYRKLYKIHKRESTNWDKSVSGT